MKLPTFDPMPALRQARKDRVNAAYNQDAANNAHLNAAYAQKREWAKTDLAKLKPEADLRGITTEELSNLILSKPDLVSQREASRQQMMARIDAAKTPSELEAL